MDKGLLVVSFGTSHNDTCRDTILAIEEHLAKAMADRRSYRGWTSRFIIRKLKERDGVEIDTVEEALDRMSRDGIRDLLIVPTHLLAGSEYEKIMDVVGGDGRFDTVRVGRPLLSSDQDMKELVSVLAEELKGPLVLMGHGSSDRPEVNEVYVRLEQMFREAGHDDVFVGTVEGSPTIDEVISKLEAYYRNCAQAPAGEELREGERSKLLITPLMIVAGDHAKNDMAGDDPDSWKNRITTALSDKGIEVEVIPVIRGLGSYRGVQEMFERHASRAEEIV